MLRLIALLGLLAAPAWGACTGGTPPASASAVGYTCRTFYDDFTSLSTIDTTNTKAPGFKWYPGQLWPRSLATANWPGTTLAGNVVPATWYSIGAGGLVLTPLVDDTLGQLALMTCAPTTTTPYWTGTAITGGFLLRTVQSVTGTTGANAWPLIWTWPVEFLTGGQPGNLVWIEDDHFHTRNPSGPVTPIARFLLWWSVINGVYTPARSDFLSAQTVPATVSTSESLLVPAARNGGTSKFDFIQDGTTSNVPSTGGGWTNGGHADTNELFMAQNNCILLGTGSGTTMTYRSVEVWQAPTGFPGGARLFR